MNPIARRTMFGIGAGLAGMGLVQAARGQDPPAGPLPWTTRISVKDAAFGAVGDGQADDTGAIQKAIEAAAQNTVIFFPEGLYRTTRPLVFPRRRRDGQWLAGAGKYASTLVGTGRGPMIEWRSPSPKDTERNHKCGLRALAVYHTDTRDAEETAPLVVLDGQDQFTLTDCAISTASAKRSLLGLAEFTNSWIHGNEFNGGGDQILALRRAAPRGTPYNMIFGNQFLDHWGASITLIDCWQSLVEGNLFLPNDSDKPVIRLIRDQRHVLIAGNHIRSMGGGVTLLDAGATVLSNTIYHHGAGRDRSAVTIDHGKGFPSSDSPLLVTTVKGNAIHGDYPGGAAVSVIQSGDVNIHHNTMISRPEAVAVRLDLVAATRNVSVVGNVADGGVDLRFAGDGTLSPTIDLDPAANRFGSGAWARQQPRPPAAGFHNRGERVDNANPLPGTPAGWICVKAGAPGRWEGYGRIEGQG